jgi:cytochrome c oxidase subunit II
MWLHIPSAVELWLHVASAVELWLMGLGRFRLRQCLRGSSPAASPDAAKSKLAPSCGVRGAGWPHAAAIQGVETTMPVFFRITAIAALAAALLLPEGAAFAGLGQPTSWQIGLQEPGSPVMEDVVWLHTYVLWFITGITVFVLALLVAVMVKFNAKAHPTPSRTTHNTVVEVLWTVIPVVILVLIALPSFRSLFLQLNTPPADLTIKATGVTWNWKYDYPDNGDFEFDSLMLPEKDLKPGQPRLLSVDNEMVVPVNKVVRMQVTGFDVIHSFTVPSFGIKIDAIPGRLNETWFRATKEGWYYGQCSELCGKDHAFMPIAVRVVNEAEFAAWVEEAKKKFASNGPPATIATANLSAQ